MDEVWFRLTHQFENLQVQTSVFSQQSQQWMAKWISHLSQLLKDLYDERYIQQINEIRERILNLLQQGWEHFLVRLHNIHYYPKAFYRQVLTVRLGNVTKREVAFCLTGLTAGVLIGYCIGLNWRNTPRHLHHMKSIICHHYIGIEGVSTIDDAEMPIIQKSSELLIQVKATSVNVMDAKISSGYSRVYRRLLNSGKHTDLPVTLGRDCSGVVVDIGQNVIDFDIGDEVYLAVPSWRPGTMAEYLVVHESQVAKRPKLVTFEASASLPYSGCLAWDALVNGSVISEGNARGKRVLVYGGTTPVGCILIQLIKLWGGHVVSACKPQAIPVTRALGADEVIPLNGSDIEKELELHDLFDAIFYTGGPAIAESLLKKHLLPYGSYVSTVAENLTSDSMGFIFGSIFAGYVRIKLLIQYIFGLNMYQWKDGAKLKTAYLHAIRDLVDADKLQTVVDRAYYPMNIEHALTHVLDPNAIGSTIIKFQ